MIDKLNIQIIYISKYKHLNLLLYQHVLDWKWSGSCDVPENCDVKNKNLDPRLPDPVRTADKSTFQLVESKTVCVCVGVCVCVFGTCYHFWQHT